MVATPDWLARPACGLLDLLWCSPVRGGCRLRRLTAATRTVLFPGDVASVTPTDFAGAITDW